MITAIAVLNSQHRYIIIISTIINIVRSIKAVVELPVNVAVAAVVVLVVAIISLIWLPRLYTWFATVLAPALVGPPLQQN